MFVRIKVEGVVWVDAVAVDNHPQADYELDYVGCKIDEAFPFLEAGKYDFEEVLDYVPEEGCSDCGRKDPGLEYRCINIGDRLNPDYMVVCHECAE